MDFAYFEFFRLFFQYLFEQYFQFDTPDSGPQPVFVGDATRGPVHAG